MTGGGSGGHLTPIMSVADALRGIAPGTKLVYIGQKGDSLGDIMKNNPLFDKVYTVHAGKFRRYHGEGWKQILDIKTMAKNARDMVLVAVGLVESFILLRNLRPKVLLCKGGFVGVPVGLAAAMLRIPYVTHDSDSLPGLANRIISRWAHIHAVGMPKETYHYPQDKTVTVGVPIQKHFKPVTDAMKSSARRALGVPEKAKVIFVIGGGQGAQQINDALLAGAKKLFELVPQLYVLHVAGRKVEEEVRAGYAKKLSETDLANVQVFGFTSDVARLSAAADVVITRAGATNMAEFAQQGKACIVIPGTQLTGGHQLKNASVFHKQQAAIVLLETDLKSLATVTADLLGDRAKQVQLGANLQTLANPNAAQSLAALLVAVTERR